MQAVYIAMWSGPRNISTALMRAWGNRADTFVCDEPLYAHYLLQTGAPHPGREEIIAHHETDWRKVATMLTGAIPGGRSIFYQKHMAHHLLPEIDRAWLTSLRHAFLIREPREMLISLAKVTPDPLLSDTGLVQQVELFEQVHRQTGRMPPVIDAKDVLLDPRRLLVRLCEALDVTFDEAMLTWPAGPRPTDGIWAKHWYEAVDRSTGFEPYRPREQALPERLTSLLAECMGYYNYLYNQRLT